MDHTRVACGSLFPTSVPWADRIRTNVDMETRSHKYVLDLPLGFRLYSTEVSGSVLSSGMNGSVSVWWMKNLEYARLHRTSTTLDDIAAQQNNTSHCQKTSLCLELGKLRRWDVLGRNNAVRCMERCSSKILATQVFIHPNLIHASRWNVVMMVTWTNWNQLFRWSIKFIQ